MMEWRSIWRSTGEKRMLKDKKITLISLGCPKNLVDSELILGKLGEVGCILTPSYKLADVIIINTCSFISGARKESYEVISKVIRHKSPHQKLIVCGCLSQLEKVKLFSRFPQIDALLGSGDFYRIEKIIEKLFNGSEHIFSVATPEFIYTSDYPRLISTPPGYAYLKIAEGCSNRCSYCLIPHLRGNFRSRELEDVVREAKNMASMGVKEIILIAQDTTYYGRDKGENSYLLLLLKKLEKISKIEWIRMLYLHPLHFDFELIKIMQNSPKICRYLDMPIQHTHNEILKLMGRPPFEVVEKIINRVREKIPQIVIRTTLMVGFPGEKPYHFNKLLKDVERLEFDWLGVFTYSPERNTPAFSLPEQIPAQIKNRRKEEILRLQESITLRKNQSRVGKNYTILVDVPCGSHSEEGEGHTWFQTPDIDGKVFFKGKYTAGSIFQGKVISVKNSYDLYVTNGYSKDKQERI